MQHMRGKPGRSLCGEQHKDLGSGELCHYCDVAFQAGHRPEDAKGLNLDALPLSELERIAEDSGYHPSLREYAGNKANAMSSREAGMIAQALVFESWCEDVYARLPEDLRW